MSKIIGWILKQKESKLSFSFLIVFAVVSIFNIFLIIFDLIQFIVISQNSARIANIFFGINIAGILLNFGVLCYYIVVVILKSRKIKSSTKDVGKK